MLFKIVETADFENIWNKEYCGKGENRNNCSPVFKISSTRSEISEFSNALIRATLEAILINESGEVLSDFFVEIV